jgi:hypothetical protein
LEQTPTYYARPIDLAMLRNMPTSGEEMNAIAATLFGTRGGHMHTNGLAVELFGAGHVLGVDSGRGSSYWQKDHNEYYRKPPAHNTVIPMGNAHYPDHGVGTIAMDILKVEPHFNKRVSEGNITYITAGFNYKTPAASQQRTLALVRVDDETAFFFDVMRSRLDETHSGEYHDWLYHAMADSAEIGGIDLEPSTLLSSEQGNLKGYDYFENERSAEISDTLHVRFPLEIEDDKVGMDLWMVGNPGRRVFLADAPANRAARHNFPEVEWNRPIPLLLVRQNGEAWDRPFVTVYEPYQKAVGRKIQTVEEIAPNTWKVSGEKWSTELKLDNLKLEVEIQSPD